MANGITVTTKANDEHKHHHHHKHHHGRYERDEHNLTMTKLGLQAGAATAMIALAAIRISKEIN